MRSPVGHAPETASRRLRVLIVDDEAFIGAVFERLLRDDHEVVAFTDPHAALAAVLAGERFDFAFCDILMPEMCAWDFFPALRAADPALAERTLFVTGGAFTRRAEQFVAENRWRTLEKPVEVETIRRMLARLDPGPSERNPHR